MTEEPQARELLRLQKPVYGGDSLARTSSGKVVLLPFVLPGELIQMQAVGGEVDPTSAAAARVVEASPDRVSPACVHFGVCGGCQYQMADYPAQVAMKQIILEETLNRSGHGDLLQPGTSLHIWPSPQPYGYRNRIRLKVRRLADQLRLGYNVRGTTSFLPVTMCPIAAPLLWRAAEALLNAARTHRDLARWLGTAAEVEFFSDGEESKVQMTLLYSGKPPRDPASFARAIDALHALLPELAGAGAVQFEPRSGRALAVCAAWGADALPYRVAEETFWLPRASFFQVNRFLLPTLVDLVCAHRTGALAWDLYAGAGLFSRVLARRFTGLTAVEASPVASTDLARSLARLGPNFRGLNATTLDFLRRAVLQRDRPDLVVLDPPRAGAGEKVCELLARIAPAEIVYVSCDPTTLARGLGVLTRAGYAVQMLHLLDLFPQTYHLETIAILHRA